jgi:hypothetical protein
MQLCLVLQQAVQHAAEGLLLLLQQACWSAVSKSGLVIHVMHSQLRISYTFI